MYKHRIIYNKILCAKLNLRLTFYIPRCIYSSVLVYFLFKNIYNWALYSYCLFIFLFDTSVDCLCTCLFCHIYYYFIYTNVPTKGNNNVLLYSISHRPPGGAGGILPPFFRDFVDRVKGHRARGGPVVLLVFLACFPANRLQWCDGLPASVHEAAAAAGRGSLRPGGEACPAARSRSHGEEAAGFGPAAAKWEGTVGDNPGAGTAAAHIPRHGRRFGKFRRD